MATINLGSIKFNWQGAYNGATAYSVDDVVSYNGSSYICKLASTGNLPTNTTYFDQMSSAGTNGTDLTTTLTTQGDIVYRDGSGLQRLGAGTAGQVLQTGGAGANPSWGTVSSDFVKLASGSVSGSATTLSIDGYYSSDYKNYKLYFTQVQCSNNQIRARLNAGGSEQSGANYKYIAFGYQNNLGSNTVQNYSDWGGNYINVTNWGAGNGWGDVLIFDIIDPESTTFKKKIRWEYSSYDTNEIHNLIGQAIYDTAGTTVNTGITIYTGGGANFSTGDWYLYGIK